MLSSKIITPTLVNPVDIRTVLGNIQKVIPKYITLPNEANPNIWSFYSFLKVNQ